MEFQSFFFETAVARYQPTVPYIVHEKVWRPNLAIFHILKPFSRLGLKLLAELQGKARKLTGFWMSETTKRDKAHLTNKLYTLRTSLQEYVYMYNVYDILCMNVRIYSKMNDKNLCGFISPSLLLYRETAAQEFSYLNGIGSIGISSHRKWW